VSEFPEDIGSLPVALLNPDKPERTAQEIVGRLIAPGSEAAITKLTPRREMEFEQRDLGRTKPATTKLTTRRGMEFERRNLGRLELVDHIAKEAELTKVSAAAALEAVLGGITKTLKNGEEVRLAGFGTFSVRERAAGKGRNPATSKEIKIAASRNARFKPGPVLKASLKRAAAKK
jgi:DNA-binding protein HU-beta